MKLLNTWLGRIGGAVGLSLALGSCASAQSAASQPAADEQEVVNAVGPALWRLRDADTTIYLFGTVHALPEGTNWYDARIQRAFASSEELVTEIDMSAAATSAGAMAQAAMLTNGQTVRQLMTAENRAQYEAEMTRLGLPVAALDPVEPWFAALNLTMLPLMQSGFSANAGVDTVLTAQSTGMRKTALETIEEQVSLFDGLPMDSQLVLLDSAVEGSGEVVETLNAMIASWIAGDAEELARLMNADMDDPTLFDRLLHDRNANWVEWIAGRMEQPGTVFVAVGAGHLAGQGSVQDLLDARGYEVERVNQ